MCENIRLITIHGATASSSTFDYMLAATDFKSVVHIQYTSKNSFRQNLLAMSDQIDRNTPTFVVAHSLGGIYALHLLQTHNIVGAVTASTPYAGSESAVFLSWAMPKIQLFKDINPYSQPIHQSKSFSIQVPWLQLVSTRGHKMWSFEPNDGIVTRSSMTYRADMRYMYLPYNHYQIMQSPETVKAVIREYQKISIG
jgi:pimeloyl-ACP methyl ester carboxylesterase